MNLLDIIESSDFEYFGVRSIPGHYGVVRVGEELNRSWHCRDDVAEYELDGTSTMGVGRYGEVTQESLDCALECLEVYSGGIQTVLVGGRDAGMGRDRGERLIDRAVVLAII